MFLMPRLNRASRSATAFCSYHETIKDNGRPFTSVPNASARALAIRIAEYTSLHCQISRSLGSPATVPKSSLLKRYLPHARVRIMQSSGTIVAKSVK